MLENVATHYWPVIAATLVIAVLGTVAASKGRTGAVLGIGLATWGCVLLLGRRPWPFGAQLLAAVGLAILVPPVAAGGLLVAGCYFFGSCP